MSKHRSGPDEDVPGLDKGTQAATESDLIDPATVGDAPHDRGHVPQNGEYRDAVDEMYDRVKADLKAWKEGITQNGPARRH
jgi:hypothetical protein